MEVRKYIRQRKSEILAKTSDEDLRLLVLSGWNFIEDRIAENFKELTPEATRKIEMLEAMLSNFITHGFDMSLLDELDKQIKEIGVVGGRQIQ